MMKYMLNTARRPAHQKQKKRTFRLITLQFCTICIKLLKLLAMSLDMTQKTLTMTQVMTDTLGGTSKRKKITQKKKYSTFNPL